MCEEMFGVELDVVEVLDVLDNEKSHARQNCDWLHRVCDWHDLHNRDMEKLQKVVMTLEKMGRFSKTKQNALQTLPWFWTHGSGLSGTGQKQELLGMWWGGGTPRGPAQGVRGVTSVPLERRSPASITSGVQCVVRLSVGQP